MAAKRGGGTSTPQSPEQQLNNFLKKSVIETRSEFMEACNISISYSHAIYENPEKPAIQNIVPKTIQVICKCARFINRNILRRKTEVEFPTDITMLFLIVEVMFYGEGTRPLRARANEIIAELETGGFFEEFTELFRVLSNFEMRDGALLARLFRYLRTLEPVCRTNNIAVIQRLVSHGLLRFVANVIHEAAAAVTNNVPDISPPFIVEFVNLAGNLCAHAALADPSHIDELMREVFAVAPLLPDTMPPLAQPRADTLTLARYYAHDLSKFGTQEASLRVLINEPEYACIALESVRLCLCQTPQVDGDQDVAGLFVHMLEYDKTDAARNFMQRYDATLLRTTVAELRSFYTSNVDWKHYRGYLCLMAYLIDINPQLLSKPARILRESHEIADLIRGEPFMNSYWNRIPSYLLGREDIIRWAIRQPNALRVLSVIADGVFVVPSIPIQELLMTMLCMSEENLSMDFLWTKDSLFHRALILLLHWEDTDPVTVRLFPMFLLHLAAKHTDGRRMLFSKEVFKRFMGISLVNLRIMVLKRDTCSHLIHSFFLTIVLQDSGDLNDEHHGWIISVVGEIVMHILNDRTGKLAAQHGSLLSSWMYIAFVHDSLCGRWTRDNAAVYLNIRNVFVHLCDNVGMVVEDFLARGMLGKLISDGDVCASVESVCSSVWVVAETARATPKSDTVTRPFVTRALRTLRAFCRVVAENFPVDDSLCREAALGALESLRKFERVVKSS